MDPKQEYLVYDCMDKTNEDVQDWLNAWHEKGYSLVHITPTGFREGDVIELRSLLIMRRT